MAAAVFFDKWEGLKRQSSLKAPQKKAVKKMKQWGKWLDEENKGIYLVNRLVSLTVNTKKAMKIPALAIAQCQVKLGKDIFFEN